MRRENVTCRLTAASCVYGHDLGAIMFTAPSSIVADDTPKVLASAAVSASGSRRSRARDVRLPRTVAMLRSPAERRAGAVDHWGRSERVWVRFRGGAIECAVAPGGTGLAGRVGSSLGRSAAGRRWWRSGCPQRRRRARRSGCRRRAGPQHWPRSWSDRAIVAQDLVVASGFPGQE